MPILIKEIQLSKSKCANEKIKKKYFRLEAYRAINKRHMPQQLHLGVLKPRHITWGSIFFPTSISPVKKFRIIPRFKIQVPNVKKVVQDTVINL